VDWPDQSTPSLLSPSHNQQLAPGPYSGGVIAQDYVLARVYITILITPLLVMSAWTVGGRKDGEVVDQLLYLVFTVCGEQSTRWWRGLPAGRSRNGDPAL
jgi:hypothetical protein